MGKRETSRGFSATQVSTATATNSTSEVTVFSQLIPAGKMGTSKKLSLDMLATINTPLVSLPSMTIRIRLGTATLIVANSIGLAVSQSNTPVVIEATIRNKDSATAQIAYARVTQNANNLPMLIANSTAVYGDWTVDTSVDQTLSVTVQFSLLSGSTSFDLRDVDMDLS